MLNPVVNTDVAQVDCILVVVAREEIPDDVRGKVGEGRRKVVHTAARGGHLRVRDVASISRQDTYI